MVFDLKLFIGCLILLLLRALVNTFHFPSKFKQYNTQTHCFTTTLVGTFHATSSAAAPPYSPAIHPASPYLTAKYPIELGITLAGDSATT